jgi:AcrR family transcriptional regulator
LLVALLATEAEDRELSVASVCARAKSARTTFYEHFDDVAHARAAARGWCQAWLEARLSAELQPSTPAEALRFELIRWHDAVVDDDLLSGVLLRVEPQEVLGIAGRCLEKRLTLWVPAAARAGLVPKERADSAIVVACGAAESVLRFAVARTLSAPRTEHALVESVLRLLR